MRPRSGATYKEPLDILLPALMKLRHCEFENSDSSRLVAACTDMGGFA